MCLPQRSCRGRARPWETGPAPGREMGWGWVVPLETRSVRCRTWKPKDGPGQLLEKYGKKWKQTKNQKNMRKG